MSHSRRVLFVLVLATAVAVFVGGCIGSRQEPVKKPIPKPIPSKTVGLRQQLAVGAFDYELLRARETTIIGPPKALTSAKSKGVFVVLKFRAELATNAVRTLDRREMSVVDANGRVYQSSQDAQSALTAGKKPNLFKQETTYRGIPVEGWVAFDVDKKAKNLRVKIINLMDPKSFIGYIKLPF